MENRLNKTHHIYQGSLLTEYGRADKWDQDNNNDSTDHINQHENTTIYPA